METRDWIAIGAALISLWSLYSSKQTAGWAKKSRGIDLRAELLLLMVDIAMKIAECQRITANARAFADRTGDLEIYKLAESMKDRLEPLAKHFKGQQRAIEALKPEQGIDLYVSSRHKMEELSQGVASLYRDFEGLQKKLDTLSS